MALASSAAHLSGTCTCRTNSAQRRLCPSGIIFTDAYDQNRSAVGVDALRHTFVALVEADKSAALTTFLSEDLPRRVLREFLLSRPISAVPLCHEEQLTPRSLMRTSSACAPTTATSGGGADGPTRHASAVLQPMLRPSATGVDGTQRGRNGEPTEEKDGTTAPTRTSFPAACNEAATLITASGQRIATMIESIVLDIIFTTRFARVATPPSSLDAAAVAVRTDTVGEEHGGSDATNATPQLMPQSSGANVAPFDCDQNDASHNALRQSTSTRSAATAAAVQRHPHTCRVGYHSDHPYTCLDVAAMNNNPLVAEALRRGADGAAAAATGAIAAAVAAGSECEVLVNSSGDHSTSTSGAPSVYYYPPATTQFVRWLRCHCFDGRATLDTFGFGQSSPHVAAPTDATDVPNIRSRPSSSPPPPPPLLQLLALESNSAAMLRWILEASLLRPSSLTTASSPSALSFLPLPSSPASSFVCSCYSLSRLSPRAAPLSPPLSPPSPSSSSLCPFGWPCSIADAAVDYEGRTLLHVAAGGIVTRRVVGGGVDDPSPSPPSAAGVVASTASCVASAVFVQMVAVRLLIAEGTDVNAADARGRTPLFAATQAAAKSARRNNAASTASSPSSSLTGRPMGEEEEEDDDFSVFSPPPASLFLWQAHAGRAPQIVRLLRDKGASLRPSSFVVPTTRSSVHASPSPCPSGKRARSGAAVVAAPTAAAAAALAPAAVPSVPATTTTVRTAPTRSQEQRKHFRSAIALFGQLQRQREQRRQQQQQQPLPSPSSDTPTSPPQPPLPPPPPSD